MKDFSKEIKLYCLKSILEYGNIDTSKIMPKLFSHGLQKEDIKEVMPVIVKIAKEVESFTLEEKQKQFESLKNLLPEKEGERKGLPEIDIKGIKKVVTRLAPEPSKYNHLGHALTFLINYLYAKRYKGKCLLRFEDTNPEKVSQEYVDAMKEDVLKYLDIKVSSIRFVSDDMKLLYKYALELIRSRNAFVCFCGREKMQDLRHKGIECECREFPSPIQEERWKLLLKGEFEKGEAVLRIKGNMQSLNHVMRDSVLFRQIEAKHYRHGKKYRIWPMYDFYNPIEDSIMGVSLILRSNEFDLRVELQDHIKDLLKLKKQKIIQYGRFNVIDFTTKGREIRELIESGELLGWDDPRLITLRALKRSGITNDVIYELANQVGLSKHPVNLDFDMIASINRKWIASKTNRYFFVENPIQLEIKGKPKEIKTVALQFHPDRKDVRFLKVGDIFISASDFNTLKGKELRLLHLFNVSPSPEVKKNKAVAEFTSIENKDIPKIQWVSEHVKTKILMPTGEWISGIAESSIKKLKPGTVIQFERFGFVRFDKKSKEAYEFWFAHK